MNLSWRARVVMGLTRGLGRIGMAPTPDRILRRSAQERMDGKVPALLTGRVPSVRREDRFIEGGSRGAIRVRLYFPPDATAPAPTVAYFHGGGWIGGGIPSCDHICARLARAGALVMSVEYGLAPEHPFPAALTDCQVTARWLHEHAGALGGDPRRLVVAGDSAGGNLAAALAIWARGSAEALPIAAQVLVYPALDHTASTPGRPDYEGTGMSVRDLAQCSVHYLGQQDPSDPLASPLLVEDCAGLPPTLLMTAAHDPLFPEGRAFAARLAEAGVPVHYCHYENYAHAFFSVPTLYPGMKQVWGELTTYVQSVAPVGSGSKSG